MSKEDYEREIAALEAAGLSEPKGRLYHAAYGDDEIRTFEVWESKEEYEAHREHRFTSIEGAALGGVVEVGELHSARPD